MREDLEWLEERLRRAKNGTMSAAAWGFVLARLAAMRRRAAELEGDQTR